MKPKILILHASGTNRDGEAARACELAGGAPEIVHINQLRAGERRFADYDSLLLPGGFSYGDALGAGVRLALDMHVFFDDQLHEFIASGKRVLGICNGFQALVKAGLLPGWEDDRVTGWQGEGEKGRRGDGETTDGTIRNPQFAIRNVTLTHNASGRFECRWVHLAVNGNAKASFLSAIREPIFCPIAHGEGNFQVTDEATVQRLEAGGLVAFRYVDTDGNPAGGRYPLNPNGSVADIAGICNPAGNVVGLMPHPEDHITAIQNPLRSGGGLGLSLFEALINE
ncbi:MAG: phosphoribosylformylglycinamidine synthase I [Caldilineaceae bacterium]|nr:phosphoribosylformylglycinamidine synthase I [Caldilineaceae bacterium]